MIDDGLTPIERRERVSSSLTSMTMYALSMTCALAFNDLIKSFFDSFPFTTHLIGKIIYTIFIFGLTVVTAYTSGATISS